MRRIGLVVGLAVGLVLAPLVAEAQQVEKTARVGVLSPGPGPVSSSHVLEAFRQRLRELGYIEGRNLAIEWRFAAGDPKHLPEFASELVRLNVDVIIAINTPAAQAAKRATVKIPTVFVQVADMAGSDVVESLARPGGNVTGLVSNSRELTGKRLELLVEALPGVRNIGVLRDSNPMAGLIFRDMDAASHQRGLRLTELAIRGRDELPRAIEDGVKHRVGALVVIDGVAIAAQQASILKLAREKHLPVISQFREFVEAGGLMAYGPSLSEMYRRAATYVDRILKGTKPSELPVEQPTKFELVLNLKTAKALGLTIPQSLLLRADQVIE
jgi:putative tryptophan/tyrosine transport system substrate-binding protein